MAIEMSRRDALRVFGASALFASGVRLGAPSQAQADSVYPRMVWEPDSTLLLRAAGTSVREQVLFTTIMRVDTKLSNPLDRYYLWHSTHDAPILRLYTAPAITGPFVEQPLCQLPGSPPGWDQNHFQAPDIVWEPSENRFLATFHSKDPVGQPAQQNSFLLTSPDGRTWTYAYSDSPMVPLSAPGGPDDYAIDYGRFLRDYDGNIVKRNGLYVWYFRATQHVNQINPTNLSLTNPTATQTVEYFQLGAATSPDLQAWTKSPIYLDPGNRQLFAPGSALDVDGKTYLMWTIATDGITPAQMYLKTGTGTDPMAWDLGPGQPVYQEITLLNDGGSYIIDPASGTHYMTYAAIKPSQANDQYEVQLIRSPVTTDPLGT